MEKFIRNLFDKNSELFKYVIVGFLTTLINFIVYLSLTRLFSFDELLANPIAWLVALIFSFITNKIYVFESKENKPKEVLIEFSKFFIGRLFTLFLDQGIMYLGIKVLKINDIIVQFIKQVIIIILNYILGKLSFKTKK